jgi:hypothetical protein
MTTILPRCEPCGTVELHPADITLALCTNAALSRYSFTCPRCGLLNDKPAPLRVYSVLMHADVTIVRWAVPAEALEPHSGPVINADDLLTFHYDLIGDFARLADYAGGAA